MKFKTHFKTYLPEETEDRVVDYLLRLKRERGKKVQQRFLNEMLIGVFLYDWNGFKSSHENEIINLADNINIISKNWSIQLQDETHCELGSYKSEINKRLNSIIHENPKPKKISAQKITSAIFQHVFCESFDQEIFNILKEALITFYDTETPPWTSEKHKINDEDNCLKLENFFNSGYPYFDVQDERIIKLLKHNLAILGVSEKDSNNSINQSLIESIFEYKQNELSSSLEDYYDEDRIVIKLFEINERLTKLLARSKVDSIHLNLKEISKNNASILSTFSGDGLVLTLQELSPEVAKSLSKFKGSCLNLHLKRLDLETAQQLVNFKGTELAFDGINKIESKVAGELSKFKGSLVIDDLATIDAKSAHELSKHVGKLVLGGPFKLEKKSADSLAKLNGDLWLCDIKKIDEEIAECLSYCSGRLVLDGIKKIESNPAKWLAKINGTLQLNGLQNIDDSVANKLAEHKGELWLSGIKQLDDNVARNLVKHGSCSDDTSRRRVIEETDTMGKAAPEGNLKSSSQRLLPELNLNGLKNLNDNTAKYLSTYQGSLWLDGLHLISETAAEILSKHKGEILGLNGLNKLSESVAKSLSRHQGKIIGLNGLTQIDQGIAGILSDYAGCLGLCGLTQIDDGIAAVLSKHKGDIGLTGLVALSDKAISHFINFEFDLGLKEEIKKKLDQLKGEDAIIDYMKRAYNFMIGDRTAEEITIGSAYPLEEELSMDVKGRDLSTGLPRIMTVRSEEIRDVLGSVKAIHSADRQTLLEQWAKRLNKPGHRGTDYHGNFGRQETPSPERLIFVPKSLLALN